MKSQKEPILDLVVTRHYVAQQSICSSRTLRQCIFQEVVDNLSTVSLEGYCYNYQDCMLVSSMKNEDIKDSEDPFNLCVDHLTVQSNRMGVRGS